MELASHQPMLTALAARLVGVADADDIVQETFLRALARPPSDTGAPMAPWLATVARNLAVDLLRHRGRHVDLDEDPPRSTETTGVDPLPHRGLATLLAGLGGLTQGEVTVLLLRDGLDLDVGEVAAALETSPESVRVLHHRARKYQRAIVQCCANAMAYEAEVVRTYAAVLEHQRGHAEQAAADLGDIVARLANLPGMALHARVQRLVVLAELGRAAPAELDAVAVDAANLPSLLQILAVGRLLLERDPVAMDRALERPVGTSPFERIVRAILARIVLAEKHEPSR